MSKPTQFTAELVQTARAIAVPGKGILAADESTGTIGKRLGSIGVENNLENRINYRSLLFTTKGLGKYISGAICFEETLLGQSNVEGKSMVDLLKAENIIPGIKVDKGAQPLYGTDGETVTQGITSLAQRCKQYYEAGARFAKWRAILHISDSGSPSQLAIDQNATTLARYAAICQSQGLVPIVEPEVLMDGTHNLELAAIVTERVQAAVVKAMSDHHVILEGALLKPNMVRQGSECKEICTAENIAQATVRVLQHTIPPALPGVLFLSGGMSEEFATQCLNKMNSMNLGARPWSLSFSFGRALQQSCLKAWQGKAENVEAAQKELLLRAKCNAFATLGKYKGEGTTSAAAIDSLHIQNYKY